MRLRFPVCPLLPLLAFAAAVLAGGLVSGCATVATQHLRVTLAAIEFAEATPLETRLVATVRITNLGGTPVTLEGSAHELWVNGASIGEGAARGPVSVPAYGTATARAEFFVSHLRLAPQLRPILETGAFAYRLRSRLGLAGVPFGISLTTEGRIDAGALPGTPAPGLPR